MRSGLHESDRRFDCDEFTLMLYQHTIHTAQLTIVSRVLVHISGEHLCLPFGVNSCILPIWAGTATYHITERKFPQNQLSKS